jgi:DNA (cytosine-5)-methyltransferase 1
MVAYYNEIDPYAAQWLRNLIAAGHIAPGDVDERSIKDVKADDLRCYTQAHFFSGIGGWSCALRLAGYPDDRSVWTGSCPCQPFSAAGAGKAADDERHLWPSWFSLIRECRPATIFGEQVEAAIGWGWLDAVFADLEAEGYACGAAVLPACGIGAPHIRQRLWFVGYAEGGDRRLSERPQWQQDSKSSRSSEAGELGDSSCDEQRQPRFPEAGERRSSAIGGSSAWSNIDWLPCTDGKARPVESGTFPLAHGIPGRVGRLRAYGNAIVPQIAAEFIRSVMSDG